jgi:D-alanyl-D-alanine carboxypeptidase/D-alanyl-D-alanine-endopeptidase (penicillin-binding protein 4)
MSRHAAPAQTRPVRRRLLLVVPLVLLLGLGGAGAWGWRTDRLDDWWHQLRGDAGAGGPAAVRAPKGVDAPDVVRPGAVARAVDTSRLPARAKVAAALAGDLAKSPLGPHVLAAVGPLAGHGITYRYASSGSFLATPASTTKVVTSTAALFVLGADHTFTTRTVLTGSGASRRLVLVGGGDPYLMTAPPKEAPEPTYELHRADVTTLAARTAAALKKQGVRQVRLGFDDSLFTGPSVNPEWEPDYVSSSVVSPVSALWVDDGLAPAGGRSADPALAATQAFQAALVKDGIKVAGAPARTRAPAGARQEAAVSSAPLADIVQRVLQVSDNDGAEVLLRHVGIAEEGQGSFTAGRTGVRRILAANGISMQGSVLYDGSGLSRHDLMSPGLLLDVLRLAASPGHPDLRPVIEGLPVAGFNGSLEDRMDHESPEGRGRVRAKTGTLSGVTSLAGIAVDRSGVPMVFVLMADHVAEPKETLARAWMDNAAAALGACSCG